MILRLARSFTCSATSGEFQLTEARAASMDSSGSCTSQLPGLQSKILNVIMVKGESGHVLHRWRLGELSCTQMPGQFVESVNIPHELKVGDRPGANVHGSEYKDVRWIRRRKNGCDRFAVLNVGNLVGREVYLRTKKLLGTGSAPETEESGAKNQSDRVQASSQWNLIVTCRVAVLLIVHSAWHPLLSVAYQPTQPWIRLP